MPCVTLASSRFVNPRHDGFIGFVNNNRDLNVEHIHDYYEISLVTSGQVEHVVNSASFPLGAGSISFIRSADRHMFKTSYCQFFNTIITPRLLKQVIGFLGDGFDHDELMFSEYPKTLTLSGEKLNTLTEELEQFFTSSQWNAEMYNTQLRLMLIKLLSEFVRPEEPAKVSGAHPEWLQKLVNEMYKEENYRRGLDAMYALSMYTPEHICRTFKKHLRMTPTALLNRIRVKNASKQLIYTNKPIIDIAYDTGFGTLSHFYHLFREHYKLSPAKYRQIYQMRITQESLI